ncbi:MULTISPECIES: amino acid synthesis family protein [Rhodopseudomonas]|uniref:Peptide synthetase n=1 Tax=Rhodopseudomonas palustris TaxID=1076 RepID=A0A0D7F4U4_RHOPL|nr:MULTISPECIES: amino acid synthesis family protein [Rhodopseudomonas]KIZ47801.1 peptide synthetase [Rhodopseudomonas palustris]MDF3811016.1 amino acid synthesis family protein [Rhodopseudomonas sp. BAL398]WOK15914.1 amino acid synthesis family protein [Rhodopseudomonas sp. BAL398]
MKKPKNFAEYHIRKWYTQVDESLANESGQLADGAPLLKYVLAAAIANPYAGVFSENLDLIVADSPALGAEFGRRMRALLGSNQVESYGKAAIVGADGEYEHGNAFLTSIFAEPVRESVGGGKAWIPSSGKRGGPGTSIDIPLAHKDALYVRSHYDTITAQFPDGPSSDEVIVAFAVASRGRLHARLGGLRAEEIRGEDGLN